MAKDSEKKGNGTKIAIIVGIVVIIALLITVIVLLIQRQSGNQEETKRNDCSYNRTSQSIFNQDLGNRSNSSPKIASSFCF